MEKKFTSSISDIHLHYKIWMSDKDEKGLQEMGYTYRRTWGNLKKIEQFFGFALLEKQRGGIDGGRTLLTPEGRKLVKAFDNFHESVDSVIQKGFDNFLNDLK